MFKNYPPEHGKNGPKNSATGHVPPKEKTGRGGTHEPKGNSPHHARPPTPQTEVSNHGHFDKLGK